MSNYTPTIGLEIHAELKTNTKMFCDSPNNPDEQQPNVNICPVCMAHPGTLPVINKEAVKHMVRIGTAVGGTIADFTEFDRKNYFYPDIPKGYQISQYKFPIVSGGKLAGVDLTRIHLEEDTATSQHDKGEYSLVNFNRAGVPLMELVTEPVIHDADTAMHFAKELQLLLRYLGASDANMEKGEMRVEANVSVSPNTETFASADDADKTRIHADNDESKLLYKDLSYKIRGALFTVQNTLGTGHKETVYQKALAKEFEKQGISYRQEESIPVTYDGNEVGRYQPDFIVEDKILLELKALPYTGKKEREQLWQYLKGTNYRLALLANFGTKSVEIKRIVHDEVRDNPRQSVSASAEYPRKSATPLGVKVEVKNLNSFRVVGQAIAYEIKRQAEVLERGEQVVQETRGWDENKGETFSQRKKEEADDYRYFPDPDLPKLKLSEIPELQNIELPELPWEKRQRYTQYGIGEEAIEVFVGDTALAAVFEKAAETLEKDMLKTASNYLTTDVVGLGLGIGKLTPESFATLIAMNAQGDISSRGTKDILKILVEEGGDPRQIAEEKNMFQKSDEGELKKVVEEVIAENSEVAEEYKQGKEKSLQFLVGQGMKKTKGSANPQMLQELFKESLKGES